MKIVFYNESLMSGGIEKCIELLIDYLYPKNDIEIVYIDEKKLDSNIVKILSQKAYVHKLNPNEKVIADVCIWCRLYMDYGMLKDHIIAPKNLLWVHSKPREKENCILDDKSFINFIDKIICVSNTVKEQLLVDKSAEVIHNFLPSNIIDLSNSNIENDIFSTPETLKLVTVSRLSAGKGFDRVLNLVKMLKQNNIKFEYIIIGKGRAKEEEIKNMFIDIPEVRFIGYKENPYSYIKRADYLVQLSDYETWGNVITEAKFLNTPVITTNFQSAYEQIQDDYNGIIIDLKEHNYEIYLPKIINNFQKYKNKLKQFHYQNEIEKWNEVLFNTK